MCKSSSKGVLRRVFLHGLLDAYCVCCCYAQQTKYEFNTLDIMCREIVRQNQRAQHIRSSYEHYTYVCSLMMPAFR